MMPSIDARLAKRASFDLLNSIGVTRDIVTWRKSPRPLTRRLIDRWTGKEYQLDSLFESHVSDSLNNLATLIATLRDLNAESDAFLIKAIGKLQAVQGRLSAQEQAAGVLSDQVITLERSLRSDLNQMQERMQVMDAQLAVDRVLSWLKDKASRAPISLADLWHVTDELWWGNFGGIMRRQGPDPAADAVREYFKREFRRLLGQQLGVSGSIPLEPLLEATVRLPEEEWQSFELLTLDPDWKLRPLTCAVVRRSTGTTDVESEARAVPFVTSADRLGSKLFEEAKRGTS